jgi:hypothetical protein
MEWETAGFQFGTVDNLVDSQYREMELFNRGCLPGWRRPQL